MSDATAFSDDQGTTGEQIQNLAEQLVGEGKRYATVEELAKGKLEADKHIKGLEANYAELKAELDKRLTTEELLKQVTNRQEKDSGTTKPAAPAIDVDKILEQAEQRTLSKLSKQEAERVAAQNEKAINDKLVAKFQTMDKAAEIVRQAARENGMSVKEFQEMARTKPLLVEKLLGLTDQKQPQQQPTPVRGQAPKSVERQQAGTTQVSDEYWANMKATNPTLYYSSKMSQQRIKYEMDKRRASH